MKKWIYGCFFLLCCSVCQAGEPERVELLSSKVILKNEDGYFVLSDGSFWKAVTFVKRWRSVSEWWNDAVIVPSEYECLPNNWHLGGEIWVYPKYGNLTVDEKSASNYDEIHECTHLLVNGQTGQVIFAIALHPADCLIHIYNDVRKESFDEGYAKGRQASTQNATDVYNKGHADGYQVGYKEGYQDAFKESQNQQNLNNQSNNNYSN